MLVATEIGRVLGDFPATERAARARNMVHITGTGGAYTVYRDCGKLPTDSTLSGLLSATIASLNFAAVDQCRHFAVHGGVTQREDRVVAIPAESGHGKTTLTGALVLGGFDYLSDEAVVFEDSSMVIPYPKPFALSSWSARMLGVEVRGEETLATAADLGGKVGSGGRLTDLVLSEYGHEHMSLESLPRSQAVTALIQYSFNHYKDPARAFRIATEAARDLTVWRLEYDDPHQAAKLIGETIG